MYKLLVYSTVHIQCINYWFIVLCINYWFIDTGDQLKDKASITDDRNHFIYPDSCKCYPCAILKTTAMCDAPNVCKCRTTATSTFAMYDKCLCQLDKCDCGVDLCTKISDSITCNGDGSCKCMVKQ